MICDYGLAILNSCPSLTKNVFGLYSGTETHWNSLEFGVSRLRNSPRTIYPVLSNEKLDNNYPEKMQWISSEPLCFLGFKNKWMTTYIAQYNVLRECV